MVKQSYSTRNWATVKRLVQIIQPVDPDGRGDIKLTVIHSPRKVSVDFYEIKTYPAWDGQAVGVTLIKNWGKETYQVCVGPKVKYRTCDCADFIYRERVCKHIRAMEKLLDLGRLPLPCPEEMEF